jgi:hypothetical protein
MAGEKKKLSCVQPNARYGSSDLFRLGSPSQGILFYAPGAAQMPSRLRNAGRWNQKDAPMARVDSPPLIYPGRGVHVGEARGRMSENSVGIGRADRMP